MEAKKNLARRITARFHSEELAGQALEDFNTRFSARDLANADLPIFTPSDSRDILSVVVEALSACFQTTRSRSDARRLVEGGSVQWNGNKFSDSKAQLPSEPGVLKLDKTRAVRINA
jgi:tyrosyl-tRNA synthetase